MNRRVLHLTERHPRICRLHRADLDFLLEHQRRHIDVAFTGQGGRYQLTPRGVAGVIALPHLQLQIRPKIAATDLLFLLDPDAMSSGVLSPFVPDLFLGRFVHLIRERFSAGLHRGYVERSDFLAAPHGRLDVKALARDGGNRKDRLPCRFDEFTADVPCNQLVKATVERVAALEVRMRAELHQTREAFAEIGLIVADAAAFDAALADPQTVAYRPLLEMCRLLFDSATGTAFLIELERVFEQYVTRGFVQTFANSEIRIETQPHTPIHAPIADRSPLWLRPDLVVRKNGVAVAVVDAKWKRFSGVPDADDLHQILAYATALGAPRVALVYPGRRSQHREYPLLNSPVTLALHAIRVSGDREKCRRSLRQFIRLLVNIA